MTVLDLSPWRTSRDYRLLWSSGAISMLGSFITYVTVPLQVKQLTDSYIAVGVIGVVELVPMIVFGLYGGALADAFDRGRIVLLTEIGLGLLSLLLLVNALLPNPMLWLVYVVGAGAAALGAIQRPALDALLPRVVPREQMSAALALSSVRFSVGAIIGPAIGGLIAATFGVSVAYGCDVLSFALAVSLLWRLKAVPPPSDADKPSLAGILEGLRYAGSRPELLGTYLVDIAAMVLAMPNAVFPFLADELGAPWALGMMYAATSVGALVVTVTSGWMSKVHRHGLAVALAAGAWGLAMAGAGWSGPVWLVLFFLALAGAADCVSGLFRMTMWNQTIPDNLRGRLAGIELLSYTAGPQLSQIRAGGVAALIGVRPAIWTGGLACVAAVLCSTGLSGFIRYDEKAWPNGQESIAPVDRG
ncbi:MFS transporter [Kutzneria sp. CA-103260]|uniref:MFS transporter n=1 Tax=Kutzneria sp. CA-103260 TaxID=2802641 RepID=UPI001BA7D639|nr:MFS transporter [Kutzneria sp. CA-103260]QUQ70362.1 MFS transporter [Kutzneria sp. CA-103260]